MCFKNQHRKTKSCDILLNKKGLEAIKIEKKITTIFDEFINEVKEILGNDLERIILYGSYARRRL